MGSTTWPDLLDTLPAEILLEIMGRDPGAWYHLYQYYPRARALHPQYNWARVYVAQFARIKQNTEDLLLKTKIFGQYHSFYDYPAIITKNKFREWYWQGKHHRLKGPAVIGEENIRWCQNGQLHRDDGPALIWYGGQQEWYQHGKLHRIGGPAFIYENDCKQEWYQNDELHRDDGPAIIHADGEQEWYRHGKRHRSDGPARIYANGQ